MPKNQRLFDIADGKEQGGRISKTERWSRNDERKIDGNGNEC